MQQFLATLILTVLTKLLVFGEQEVEAWLASRKQASVDATNVANQSAAAASGDLNAIAKDGEDTLNGTQS